MWVRSTAAGIPDALFWGCTPAEVRELWRERHRVEVERERVRREREEHALGLLICEMRNQNLPKGRRPWTPERLWKRRASMTDDAEDADRRAAAQAEALSAWATAMNRKLPGSVRVRVIDA